MTATPDYMPLEIASVLHDTAEAVTIALAIPDAFRSLFAFQPGQFLNVRAVLGGAEVRRSYSICSGPGEARLRIAVKKVGGGHFSVWANEVLESGSTLDVMPPQGRFVLAANQGSPRHILGLAAGAGITPIISMAAHALAQEPATRFTLIYGNRTVDSIMFREELEDLKDRWLDRFTVVHVLSRGGSQDGASFEGRITADVLKGMAKSLVPFEEIAHAYLCGPGSMIKDLRAALFALGLPRDRVHHEFFAPGGGAYRADAGEQKSTAPPAQPAPNASGSAHIEAILDGLRHGFTAAPGETLIDAAQRAGLRVPFSCRGGMCCTCRAKVVEGRVAMRTNYSLEAWEIDQGFTLTCQAVAQTDRVVVDFDRM